MRHVATKLPILNPYLSVGSSDGWFVLNVENRGSPIYEVHISTSPFPIRDSRDSATKTIIHLSQLGVSDSPKDLS